MKINAGFRPKSLDLLTVRQQQMIEDYVPSDVVIEEPSLESIDSPELKRHDYLVHKQAEAERIARF